MKKIEQSQSQISLTIEAMGNDQIKSGQVVVEKLLKLIQENNLTLKIHSKVFIYPETEDSFNEKD